MDQMASPTTTVPAVSHRRTSGTRGEGHLVDFAHSVTYNVFCHKPLGQSMPEQLTFQSLQRYLLHLLRGDRTDAGHR